MEGRGNGYSACTSFLLSHLEQSWAWFHVGHIGHGAGVGHVSHGGGIGHTCGTGHSLHWGQTSHCRQVGHFAHSWHFGQSRHFEQTSHSLHVGQGGGVGHLAHTSHTLQLVQASHLGHCSQTGNGGGVGQVSLFGQSLHFWHASRCGHVGGVRRHVSHLVHSRKIEIPEMQASYSLYIMFYGYLNFIDDHDGLLTHYAMLATLTRQLRPLWTGNALNSVTQKLSSRSTPLIINSNSRMNLNKTVNIF